jgi:hypothetical protein
MGRVVGGVPIKVKNSSGFILNNAPVDARGEAISGFDKTLALYEFVSKVIKISYDEWIGYTPAERIQLYEKALAILEGVGGDTDQPDGGGGGTGELDYE